MGDMNKHQHNVHTHHTHMDTTDISDDACFSVEGVPMQPFGVKIDLQLGKGDLVESNGDGVKPASQFSRKLEIIREAVYENVMEHSIVVLDGLTLESGFSPAAMEYLMCAFGPGEAAVPFSGVPMDPMEDGIAGTMESMMPNHPSIRILGNTTDDNGRPSALLYVHVTLLSILSWCRKRSLASICMPDVILFLSLLCLL